MIAISGLPTADELASDLSLSLLGGGITASLADGSLTIDLGKILKNAGLDLNNLCPNTSLVKYLVDALAKLPAAIGQLLDDVIAKVNSSLGAVTVTVAGVPLSLKALTAVVQPALDGLTKNLGDVLAKVTSGLDPLLDLIGNSLLNITVNAQDESDGKFTETAVQLNLIPNGGSLPSLPALPTLPGSPCPDCRRPPSRRPLRISPPSPRRRRRPLRSRPRHAPRRRRVARCSS